MAGIILTKLVNGPFLPALKHQVTEHVETNELLIQKQFRFRRGRSRINAVANLLEIVNFKAFDCVPRNHYYRN